MTIKTIHPFPARMAPELALEPLAKLEEGSVVLDPMMGSGTVLRHATSLGHSAIGFDMDPLAVLMTQVWTTSISKEAIEQELEAVLDDAAKVDLRTSRLHWISADPNSKKFIDFWFGEDQRKELARLAFVLDERNTSRLGVARRSAVNVLRLGLSRIIVTKQQSASLARDTSHSRPHKVVENSDYDVSDGFVRSVRQLTNKLADTPAKGVAKVSLGDARKLQLEDSSIDAVVTSPPYLNAIDYLRGHRMSLVWLGHSITDLRGIRSNSVGSESPRKLKLVQEQAQVTAAAMCNLDSLEPQLRPMLKRYAADLIEITSEIARVLKQKKAATFVVGDSCLKGCSIKNSSGLAHAANLAGLRATSVVEREIPASNRYLPTTGATLSKRMRTELVMTFEKAP